MRSFVWCCSLGGPKSSNENARICSYGRLGVALKAREMTEKIVVENAVTELLAQMSEARASVKFQNAPPAEEEQLRVSSLICKV